jgi:hypothetical protein
MKATFKSLVGGAIVTLITGAAVAAPPATDPVIGTWKLNLAKSTFFPGPGPKYQIRTYAESAQGMTLTLKTTAADGKEVTTTVTFKEDGKPYAVSGNPEYDIVSAKRVDALTVQSILMTAGMTVGNSVRTVSKDGKTLTFSQKGTNAAGVKYDWVMIYDRQ